MKKGQITIFIVIGLIIILLGLLITVIVTNEIRTEETIKSSTDPTPVKTYVDSCVDRTSNDALFYFGMVGGKVKPEVFKDFLVYDQYYKIPYWYYAGENRMPTKAKVEQILSLHVTQNLQKCINDFAPFKQSGWIITQGNPTIVTSINDADVLFKVSLPVVASRQEIRVEFKDFSTKVPLRLKQMLEISSNVVETEVKDAEFEGEPLIHWNYISEITKQKYNMTAHADKDDAIVYRITDQVYLVHREPYTLQFANKIR